MMTHLGGIGWRDDIQDHPCQSRLVCDELPQLEEGPTVTAAAFRFRPGFLVGAFPYARQIFQGQSRVGLSGRLDKRFGDAMVGMPLESSLMPRQPVQQPTATTPRTPGALRGFAAQSRSQTGKAVSTAADVAAIPTLPLTSGA